MQMQVSEMSANTWERIQRSRVSGDRVYSTSKIVRCLRSGRRSSELFLAQQPNMYSREEVEKNKRSTILRINLASRKLWQTPERCFLPLFMPL